MGVGKKGSEQHFGSSWRNLYLQSFKWQGFDPVPGPRTPPINAPAEAAEPMFDEGKNKTPTGELSLECCSWLYILHINLLSMLCVSNCETEFCPKVAGVINSDSEFQIGHSRTPQGDNWHCFMPTACILLISHAKFDFHSYKTYNPQT